MTTKRDVAASLATATLLALAVALPFGAFTWLFGVSFAAPAGFALAAVAVPLLLLYVLKTTRPRRKVASVLFWQAIALEQRSQSPFKRLRRNLVLLLQLLALAALVYGLARPVIQADSRDGTSVVVIIDTSASMLARDHEESPRASGSRGVLGGTRFDAARRRALQLVQGLGPRDQATLIACDRVARTVVPWTRDEAALEAGLASLEARHAGTALGEGLILAASARRAASGDTEFHLLSDGGGPTPPPIALGGPLHYHAFGTTAENLGVVAIDARPRIGPATREAGAATDANDEALAYEVFAQVRNAGTKSREVFVGLERDGKVLAARRLSVPPGSDRPVVLESRLAPGAVNVRLLPPVAGKPLDALPVDDTAYVLIPEERGVPVGLVSPEPSPALERALAAAGAHLRHLSPDTFRDDPQLRLYVFEGFLPASLPPRDCLIVAPPRPVGPVGLGEAAGAIRPAGWDREDPFLRYVDLQDLEVAAARPLELGGGARVLLQGEVQATGQPAVLLAAWRDGPANRVVVGFDLYASTWPLRASFPIFVRNCVLAASARDRLARTGVPAGVPVAIPVPTDAKTVTISAPDGRTEAIDAWSGRAYYSGTRLTGVYAARTGERVERFCVNLTDPAETAIEPRESVDLGPSLARAGLEPSRPAEVARWFAMIALVLLVVEFWVYHRRLD